MGRLLHILATPKLTPLWLALLGLAAFAAYSYGESATPWLAGPLLLLAANLAAAVATNPVFRRQMPLLVFHLALIALVLLAAAGRLTYLKGAADVTEGTAFAGLWRQDAGPLHDDRLYEVRFVNEGFEITYQPGPVRDLTLNRVRLIDDAGEERVEEIADDRPLVSHGYRFYPSANKGYAPLLLWLPNRGTPELGAVHLPGYPANRLEQARYWRPAGASADIWVMLDIAEEELIPADRASRFSLPARRTLVLRRGDARWEVEPGGRVTLPDGEIEYVELRTWMGYIVFYDWTLPWMLASCTVAVLSLGAHFGKKFAVRPWNGEA